MACFLAVDIGASSGRHLLGELVDGRLEMQEVYRFENGMTPTSDGLIWDAKALFDHVVAGIARCKELGRIPVSMAIDTWGVDYVLLDEQEQELWPCIAYRNSRTAGVAEQVFTHISKEELYARTGIQQQDFNTIYQLYCDKQSGKLDRAAHFLMMPEYLSYKLTGVMKNEYTNASTTNLLNAETKTWDAEVLDALGIPSRLFLPLDMPGAAVGGFTAEIQEKVGFDCLVRLCPSHDTASAVVACPVDEHSVFISSGTWSLVGTENLYPVTTLEAMKAELSNEGGIDHRFCLLTNIMGMWLLQSIRRNLDKKYTYDEMMYMAMESEFTEKIDPTNEAFLAPDNMVEAVRTYLGRPDLPLGDVLNCVYHSLADTYRKTVEEIERIAGKTVDTVSIVGGGCQDRYLNRLTKEYTGRRVTAGPIEGTATGNILSQMMAADASLSLQGAREIVVRTFDIQEV